MPNSLRSALEHRIVQGFLACALLVPVVATTGQYWSSGYWWQSGRVELLFWPGTSLHWAISMPVWASMGAMLASYVAGIAWLCRRRTLSFVALASAGALVAANLLATGVNWMTGWRELQTIASMDLAGKADRAIFSLWHNPAWEEVVFRGLPLVLLLFASARWPRSRRSLLWAYYLVPAVVFAAYHVPGHGPSRIADTLILSLVFSWMTLRYTFFAPLVMHYVFDAVMTMSLGKMPRIPRGEVAWLADHAVALNSTWTIALLLWLASIAIASAAFWFVRRSRARVRDVATA